MFVLVRENWTMSIMKILNLSLERLKLFAPGKDICLISTGETLYFALQAANNLAKQGIDAEVVDLGSIKPLDTEMLGKLAQEFDQIATVEEHDVINESVQQLLLKLQNMLMPILLF